MRPGEEDVGPGRPVDQHQQVHLLHQRQVMLQCSAKRVADAVRRGVVQGGACHGPCRHGVVDGPGCRDSQVRVVRCVGQVLDVGLSGCWSFSFEVKAIGF